MAANLRRDGGRARQSPAGRRSGVRNKGTEKAARRVGPGDLAAAPAGGCGAAGRSVGSINSVRCHAAGRWKQRRGEEPRGGALETKTRRGAVWRDASEQKAGGGCPPALKNYDRRGFGAPPGDGMGGRERANERSI